MTFFRLGHRVRAFMRWRALDAGMDAEMRDHIASEAEDRIAHGMSADEAWRTAARDFGGVERFKEQARDERGLRVLHELVQDTRHALRLLRRNPAYTTAAVLTFALGIGLATSMFSVVHGVLVDPLPYENPSRLVVVWESNAAQSLAQNVVSVPMFEAWRAQNRTLTSMVAMVPAPAILGGDEPERVMGAQVSPNYFRLLGVPPAKGHDFVDADEENGGAPSIVLSDGLWRRRFGGDSSIVGTRMTLDQRPFTVVGVMPAGFDPPKFAWMGEHEFWIPFGPTPVNRRWGRFLLVMARLRDGASPVAARADVTSIADAMAHDTHAEGWSATTVSLAEQITGTVRTPLVVLMCAVMLLLLMAVTNVGSLTLGFMRRREHELAMRRAIGATPERLFRELLTHGLVLGVIGSVAGLAAAVAGTHFFIELLPPSLPRGASVRLDGAVFAFMAAVGVLSSVAFALHAAFRGVARDASALAITRATGARSSARVGRGTLVVAEIALGVVLTVCAGLMIRSFANLRAVPLGFDAQNVVTARISLPNAYDTPARQRAFFDEYGASVAAIPGVQAVSIATTRPLGCCAPSTTVSIPDTPLASGTEPVSADIRFADSSFFAALRIPLIAGSGFSARELTDGPPHVIVSRALARAVWGNANAVGRSLLITLNGGLRAEVIGVAEDARLTDPRTPPHGTAYLTGARFPANTRDLIIRSSVPLATLAPALRSAVHAIDPAVPLSQVTPLADSVERSLARDRFVTVVLAAFATVALILAAVGIYGVFSAEVTARHREIGVRLALGARQSGVLDLMLRRAMTLAATGAAIGVGAGLLLSRAMRSLLFGVTESDPLSFIAVAALLMLIAAGATIVPAMRAMRISPLEAMRGD